MSVKSCIYNRMCEFQQLNSLRELTNLEKKKTERKKQKFKSIIHYKAKMNILLKGTGKGEKI